MTMITPSYLGETIEYSSLHACRSTLEDPPDDLANSTGNLRTNLDLGEVNNLVITSSAYSYSDVADASGPVFTSYTYASLTSNPNILNRIKTAVVSADAACNVILRETTNLYDAATGNLLEEHQLVCPGTWAVTYHTYDGYGNRVSTTDPAGIVTHFDYENAAKTYAWRKYTGPLTANLIEYTLFDERTGLVLVSTNLQGMVTGNTYDPLLRLTQTSISTTVNGTANLWRMKYAYTLGGISGNLSQNSINIQRNDPAHPSPGYIQSWVFLDGLGREIQSQHQAETGNYRLLDYFYDQAGQLIVETYPLFKAGATFVKPTGTETCNYAVSDALGRLYKTWPCATTTFTSAGQLNGTPSGSSGDTGSPVGPTTLAFNDGTTPWVVVVTDPRGKIHNYYLDAFGRTNQIIEVTSGGNYTTAFKYDQVGQLTNITDNAQNKSYFFFDLTGRRVAVADPDMGLWQYRYDLAGRLVQQTDANGQLSKLYYNDPAGRLTRREGYNAANQLVSAANYAYDLSNGDPQYTVYPGQLFSVSDDEGWEKFSYDVRGRTLNTTRYLAKNLQTYTSTYTFDDADRVLTLTFPGVTPPTVTYSYDTGGNLSKVQRTDPNGVGFAYYTPSGFDEFGRLLGINFVNGASTTFSFYSLSKRLNNITTTISSGGTTIQNLTHTYDADANFATIADGVSTDTGASSSTISSTTYDDLNRVTAITWAGSGAKNYTYNGIGNITMNGEMGAGTYGYGTARPHQVKNANNVNYTYDLNGNMTYRGGQLLSYDVNNRLVQVASATAATNTFGYAYDGSRLWENGANGLQVWIGDHYEERGGKILYNIMAAGRRICTFEPAAGGSSYNPATQEFYYYHPDHLGSSSVMTDRNGTQVVQHYEYYAFGQDRYVGNSGAFPLSHRFTGQVLDADTGLYYYNFRYYDPQLGRFTQPDDIIPDFSNPQSYNRYSYCVNNPLRYTDPKGHSPDDELDDIPITLGGAHEMLRQQAGAASADLYNGAISSAHADASIARVAVEMNPVVGAYNNAYQAYKGEDALNSNKKLTAWERFKSGLMAAASVGPWILKGGKWVRATGDLAEGLNSAKAAAGVLKVGETANAVSKLGEADVVIGFVKEGKILGQFKYGTDFSLAMSHPQLADKLGVLAGNGKLADGVEAFTVAKQGGTIAVRGSNNFVPTVAAETEKILKEKFQ